MAKLVIDAKNGTIARQFKHGVTHENIGNIASGYHLIRIAGKNVLAHRLIYESVHGKIPDDMVIDHVNGNRLDNRIDNLRAVSKMKNCQMRHKVRDDSRSGVIGVEQYGESGKFCVRFSRNYKRYYVGSYSSKKDAQFAHEIALMFFNND